MKMKDTFFLFLPSAYPLFSQDQDPYPATPLVFMHFNADRWQLFLIYCFTYLLHKSVICIEA